jgi:hypothetical protein
VSWPRAILGVFFCERSSAEILTVECSVALWRSGHWHGDRDPA